MDRLHQMLGPDISTPAEVGDRPRDFEDAVIGARRKFQPLHGAFQQCPTLVVEVAKLADEALGYTLPDRF